MLLDTVFIYFQPILPLYAIAGLKRYLLSWRRFLCHQVTAIFRQLNVIPAFDVTSDWPVHGNRQYLRRSTWQCWLRTEDQDSRQRSFSWPGLLWVILHCPLVDLPQVRPFSLAAFSAWMASSKAPTRSHVYKVDQMASSSFSKSINLGQRFKAEVKSKHFFKNWLESTGNLHEVQITPISLGFWPRFKFIQFKTSPSQLGIVRTFLVAWILAKFAARVSALHKLDLEGYICKVESYVTMCILFWPRGRHVCTTSEASKAALSQKRMLALAKKTCIYMCIYIYIRLL